MFQQTPLLALLRRLEAQNIWRMSHNVLSAQPFSASAAAEAARDSSAQPAAVEWYDNPAVSAQDAVKILVHQIQQSGPIRQRHLQLLYRRCQTPDDLDKALKLTRLNYLARGELQQHKPFSHKTSQILIHQALNVGAPEVAQKALRYASEFGLSHDSYKEFHPLMIYYSKQGALQQMFEVFEFMRSHGRRPGPETCYILVKGCVDHGRPDLAELTIREFEQNGVRVREGTKLYLDQNRHKGLTMQAPSSPSAAAAAAAHPAAAAQQQQAMMGGAAAAAAARAF
ncbi:hypothetical protein ABPG77_002807 [Micractinium sp. CCAP 211/92]